MAENQEEAMDVGPDVPSSTVALQNHIIVKNIVGFMDQYDVEHCYRVNKLWNSLCLGMIKTKYTIRLTGNLDPSHYTPFTTVQLEKYSPGKQVETHTLSLQNIGSILLKIPSKEISVICLKTNFDWTEVLLQVLAHFKQSLTHVTFGNKNDETLYRVKCPGLFEFLRIFPNIRTLAFSGNISIPHARSLRHPLDRVPNLKSIKFTTDSGNIFKKTILNIFGRTGDLQNVYNFPLRVTRFLHKTEHKLIKTLTHPTPLNINLDVYDNLCRFNSMEGRLEELKIHLHFPRPQQKYLPLWQKLYSNILNETKRTLNELELQPTEAMNFVRLPILDSLTVLRLTDNPLLSVFKEGSVTTLNKFFQPELDINETFPNVTELEIAVHIPDTFDCLDIFNQYFPVEQFQPGKYFQQVQTLKLTKVMAPTVIGRLSSMFPEITRLEFDTKFCFLKRILPLIWKDWTKLEAIIVNVDMNQQFYYCESLDAVVTGIYMDKCLILKDSPGEYVKNDRAAPSISNMKALRLFQIVFGSHLFQKMCDLEPIFSNVSSSFGFRLLTRLDVSMNIHHNSSNKEEITSLLRPIIPFVNFNENYKQ